MLNKLFAALILVSVFSASPLLAQDNKRRLVLNGHGEVKLAPDMAIVDFGVESQALTAKAALDANTRNMPHLWLQSKHPTSTTKIFRPAIFQCSRDTMVSRT